MVRLPGEMRVDAVDPYDPRNREHWIKVEHLGRYLFAAHFMARFPPGQIADIATGKGYGLPELARAGHTLIAVDSDAALLAAAQAQYGDANIRFVQADLTTDALLTQIEPNSLTGIVCFETLEHLLEPGAALDQLYALLEPGGNLLVSVPSRFYESKDRSGLPYNANHKQGFSFHSLSALLVAHGFTVEYQLGQGLLNQLMRKETHLVRLKELSHRLSDFEALHSPEAVRTLARLLAYPSVEDVEGSYAIIVVAQKPPTPAA